MFTWLRLIPYSYCSHSVYSVFGLAVPSWYSYILCLDGFDRLLKSINNNSYNNPCVWICFLHVIINLYNWPYNLILLLQKSFHTIIFLNTSVSLWKFIAFVITLTKILFFCTLYLFLQSRMLESTIHLVKNQWSDFNRSAHFL